MLEGTIELRRATDESIVGMMKGHGLPALSPSKEESVDGWDYLLRLRMDRVKASAVTDAEAAVAAAKAGVEKLEATTAGQMWLADLAEFEASYEKMKVARAAACSTGKRSEVKKVKSRS